MRPPSAPAAGPRRPAASALAKSRRQQGFTLVELVISAGLIGFLAVTASYYFTDSFTLVRNVNADSVTIAEGRTALERAAREIREIKYDSSAGAYCFTAPANWTQSQTQIVFNKHNTSGAEVATCGSRPTPDGSKNDFAVTLQSGSGNLSLSYAGTLASPATTKVLCGNVSNFGLRYLDSTATNTATSTSTARYIELSLTLQPSGVQATTLRTLVALRNN